MSVSWRRFDSLFMRLFALQVALGVTVTLVFGVLFYIERNRTVAILQAEVWAPLLQREVPALSANSPNSLVRPDALLLRRDTAPESSMRLSAGAPRLAALRNALAARGIPVREIAFTRGDGAAITWLHIAPTGAAPAWYGLSGHLIEPQWPGRLLLAVLIAGGLLAWASWAFTRRMTRPLERLRDQMRNTTRHTTRQTTRDTAQGADSQSRAGPATQAPPEIAEIEAAHAELLQGLQRQERERALLLAGVSHDLRSPLARIRMAVELMPPHEDTATRRAAIVRNVQAADQLVESFVDFVRTGELPLNETVDLVPLVRKVVASCERPQAELSMQLPPRLVLPAANALLIERLIDNLIDNAFKHGLPPVAVRLQMRQNMACLEVEDAGSGIAPAARETLQQAFARGDASRGVSGTGLGLAIARQVVTRLGGTLNFELAASGHVARVMLPCR